MARCLLLMGATPITYSDQRNKQSRALERQSLADLLALSGGSYEEQRGYDRVRRSRMGYSIDVTPNWARSIEGRSHHTAFSCHKAVYTMRVAHNDGIRLPLRAAPLRWRSLMLHVLASVTMIGLGSLCMIYSYPLTGLVSIGTFIYHVLSWPKYI
jgi:hypothetical protein